MIARDSQETSSWSWKPPGQSGFYLLSDPHLSWCQDPCAKAATPGRQAGHQRGQAKHQRSHPPFYRAGAGECSRTSRRRVKAEHCCLTARSKGFRFKSPRGQGLFCVVCKPFLYPLWELPASS